MPKVKVEHLHWMYDVNTKEPRLFNVDDEYDDDEWMDTPAKCGIITDVDIVSEETKEALKEEAKKEREALKEEATSLGIDFPKNIKTDILNQMIEEAKA